MERLRDYTRSLMQEQRATDYVRRLSALIDEDGGPAMAARRFEARWPTSPNLNLVQRAAVTPGGTTDATWAAPLAALRPLTDALLELVRAETILGRVAGFRGVPFGVSVPMQTAGGAFTWVAPGKPVPASAAAFAAVTLGISKAAGIIVMSAELMKLATPAAETVARSELVSGIAGFLDQAFVDPDAAEVANVSPASITNGTTPIASSGATAANARADIQALIGAWAADNPNAKSAVLLMSIANAAALGASGFYPDVRIDGSGTLAGIQVVTSPALGTNIVLFDPSQILLADEGGLSVDLSRSASLQMDSAPESAPAVYDADKVLVSLWQGDWVGFRCVRFVHWKRARLAAVKYVSGAAYA